MTHVRAEVFKHETPRIVRKLIAGDRQYKEEENEGLAISDFTRHFLDADILQVPDPKRRVSLAMRCGGIGQHKTAVCPVHNN